MSNESSHVNGKTGAFEASPKTLDLSKYVSFMFLLCIFPHYNVPTTTFYVPSFTEFYRVSNSVKFEKNSVTVRYGKEGTVR